MSFFGHSSRFASLLIASAFVIPARPALADMGPLDERPQAAAVEREPYPFSVGLRSFIAPGLGITGMGAGLDVAYSVRPELALAAQHLQFVVDQGADPHYCARCIRSGNATLASAEGRLWSSAVVTPYARAGVGFAHLRGQRFEYDRDYVENDAVLGGEIGVDLHYRWASLRLFGFHLAMLGTELDSDPFTGAGAQIGGRF